MPEQITIALNLIKKMIHGWGCGLVLEHLTSIWEALGSIPNTRRKRKTKTQGWAIAG